MISGVERGHRGTALSVLIRKGQFVVYEAEEKSKLPTENINLEKLVLRKA